MTNSLRRAGWQEDIRIQAWSTFGYLPVVTQRSFDYYLNYHQHLLSQAETFGWAYANVDRLHHLEELKLIRELSESRIQCICWIYIYLRDNHESKWFSQEMQQERNAAMMAGKSLDRPDPDEDDVTTTSTLTSAGGSENGSPNPTHGCPKCGAGLCGTNGCIWGDLSKKKAQKAAKAAIRALVSNHKPGAANKPNNQDEEKNNG